MTSKLQQQLAAKGIEQLAVRPRTKLGKVFRSRGVAATPELRRIVNLPRRDWQTDVAELAADMTDHLRTRVGEMSLRPVQAACLQNLHDFGGLVAAVRVGGGKTLISFLAGSILDVKNVVVIVPAALKKKTIKDFHALAEHWISTPDRILVESYEMLGRESGADILVRTRPDLIIADEAHRLKNKNAAVTKRVMRFLKENPECRLAVMSGTITKRSLFDFAHLAERALGPTLTPLPTKWGNLVEWSLAVDEKLPPNQPRMPAGALKQLFDAEDHAKAESDLVNATRTAVRKRLEQTPGVVATSDNVLPVSLNITGTYPSGTCADKTRGAFQRLRELWELPDGTELIEAPAVWRHAREMAYGFYYRWETPPPKPWLDARREWAKVARDVLQNNRRGLDSEAQLARAVERGEYPAHEHVYHTWQAVRTSYEPVTIPEWFTPFPTLAVKLEIDNLPRPTLIWVSETALGDRLAALTKLPFFRQKGEDENGRVIEELDGKQSAIVSIGSCSEGRNLQAWSENLILSPPADGARWEQMLGRTHRDGQQADEINVRVSIRCREHFTSFEQALADADYAQSLTGQPQKLLLATRVMEPIEVLKQKYGAEIF